MLHPVWMSKPREENIWFVSLTWHNLNLKWCNYVHWLANNVSCHSNLVLDMGDLDVLWCFPLFFFFFCSFDFQLLSICLFVPHRKWTGTLSLWVGWLKLEFTQWWYSRKCDFTEISKWTNYLGLYWCLSANNGQSLLAITVVSTVQRTLDEVFLHGNLIYFFQVFCCQFVNLTIFCLKKLLTCLKKFISLFLIDFPPFQI